MVPSRFHVSAVRSLSSARHFQSRTGTEGPMKTHEMRPSLRLCVLCRKLSRVGRLDESTARCQAPGSATGFRQYLWWAAFPGGPRSHRHTGERAGRLSGHRHDELAITIWLMTPGVEKKLGERCKLGHIHSPQPADRQQRKAHHHRHRDRNGDRQADVVGSLKSPSIQPMHQGDRVLPDA